MHGHAGLGLPLEEGVMQLLVVDIDLSQLGPHLKQSENLSYRYIQKNISFEFLRNEKKLRLYVLYKNLYIENQ